MPQPRMPARGSTLLEVLIALAITLIVMALVAQTMQQVGRIYEAQSELATTTSAATLALDDIVVELTTAGQGLGDEIAPVLPYVPGSELHPSTLTVRSNPGIVARTVGSLLEDVTNEIPAPGIGALDPSSPVLLTDARGGAERAEVVSVSARTLRLRSLDSGADTFERVYSPDSRARVLGLREVQYWLREADDREGAYELVKRTLGAGERVLARDILSLRFDYLDEQGEAVAIGKVEDGSVSTVRVSLSFVSGDEAAVPRFLSTAVTLAASSGTVDFERAVLGFRLSRIFHPIDHPAGVATRLGSPIGVILASGARPQQDRSYLYTFPLERAFMSALVDDVSYLEDVRGPVTLAFGPAGTRLEGSLFVSAWGLRVGHLSRIAPDASGGFSEESPVTTFPGTEAIAQAGGIAFAVDDHLYVTSREKGALYRFAFDAQGMPGSPEHLFTVPGAPGSLVEGTDGFLYFLLDRGGRSSLWRMAFDETLTPVEPREVGPLPGSGISLSRDPVEGSLFALVRTPVGDHAVVELTRRWVDSEGVDSSGARIEPPTHFSLREWLSRLEEGDVDPREIPFSPARLPERLAVLRTDELDFVSFDTFGSLYMGAKEANLVLKFELDRPSGRYQVALAAGVVDGAEGVPIVRVHSWKTAGAGR